MIPKIIHYCWFGGNKKNDIIKLCIESWRNLEGYQFIEWNEKNCDFDNAPAIIKKWYKEKEWAFVSDYYRLKALYDVGGYI